MQFNFLYNLFCNFYKLQEKKNFYKFLNFYSCNFCTNQLNFLINNHSYHTRIACPLKKEKEEEEPKFLLEFLLSKRGNFPRDRRGAALVLVIYHLASIPPGEFASSKTPFPRYRPSTISVNFLISFRDCALLSLVDHSVNRYRNQFFNSPNFSNGGGKHPFFDSTYSSKQINSLFFFF